MGQYPRVTEAEALAWVMVECQATSEPCLTAVEAQHLVQRSRRADAAGRPPADDAWDPTYDLNWAAWRGWRLKADKAVLMVDVTGDGTQVSKSKVFDHCLAMAQDYARGVTQSVPAAPAPEGVTIIPTVNINNPADDTGGSLRQPGTIPGVEYP